MQKQLVWYMVYRVRNLGHHLKPKGMVTPQTVSPDTELIDPNEEVAKLAETAVREPKELYEEFKSYTDEVEVFGHQTTNLRFFPHFVLHSTEYKKEYLDRVIPAALRPIHAREHPRRRGADQGPRVSRPARSAALQLAQHQRGADHQERRQSRQQHLGHCNLD